MGTDVLFLAGFALIVVGVLIVVLALLLVSVRSAGKSKVRGGGAVIIGPVPIVFGTDKRSLKTVLLLSIVLTALALVVFVVNYLLAR